LPCKLYIRIVCNVPGYIFFAPFYTFLKRGCIIHCTLPWPQLSLPPFLPKWFLTLLIHPLKQATIFAPVLKQSFINYTVVTKNDVSIACNCPLYLN